MTRNSSGLHPVWQSLLAADRPPRFVTVIGGGGKTSLMYYLVAGLKAGGETAFAAATAKLFYPGGAGHHAVLAGSLPECRQAVADWHRYPGVITLARTVVAGPRDKLAGLDPAWLDAVAGEYPDFRFVVEGDGSAGLPLKGHLGHDPVVPAATRLLIPVIGADAIGRPLAAGHVHRPARAAELAGVVPGELVTPAMIVRLLLHPEGYLRTCPPGAAIVPFINKAEDRAKQPAAVLAAAILAAGHPAIGAVVVGSLRRGEFAFIKKEKNRPGLLATAEKLV